MNEVREYIDTAYIYIVGERAREKKGVPFCRFLLPGMYDSALLPIAFGSDNYRVKQTVNERIATRVYVMHRLYRFVIVDILSLSLLPLAIWGETSQTRTQYKYNDVPH